MPQGDAILAGNGPLLVAVAAQMTALGRPPLMIVEAGRPLLPRLQAAGLPYAYIREALSYLWTLKRAGIPWLHNAAIRRIEVIDDRLAAWIATKGSESRYEADFIALHDGLRPNSIGLPAENIDSGEGLPVVHAGDCRQTLGARAAVTSGHDAADRLLTALGDRSGAEPSGSRLVRQHMRAQRVLAAMFRPSSGHPLRELPDDTVLCRCENKTFGDLRALPGFPSVSAHQLRLNGRIGMGRCQGRFCAAWALQLVSESGGELQNETELTGRRWPVSPVSIGSLAGATLPDIDKSARSETQSD
ncbi:MAG: hypothetical protein JJ992_05025 [Planctomycetes bacterium]|nr:hypothetical protein [Planctomycetota bacterium]